jgi:hypothetical protein
MAVKMEETLLPVIETSIPEIPSPFSSLVMNGTSER